MVGVNLQPANKMLLGFLIDSNSSNSGALFSVLCWRYFSSSSSEAAFFPGCLCPLVFVAVGGGGVVAAVMAVWVSRYRRQTPLCVCVCVKHNRALIVTSKSLSGSIHAAAKENARSTEKRRRKGGRRERERGERETNC